MGNGKVDRHHSDHTSWLVCSFVGTFFHKCRSSVNFRGQGIFAGKISMKN